MGMHAKAFEWLKQRYEHATAAVEEWWKAHVVLLPPGQQDVATSGYQAAHADLVQKGFPENRIATIGFVNWVAPCAIATGTLESQAKQVHCLT